MRALLDADLVLEGTALIDTYLGVRYSLTPDAAAIVRQLQKDSEVSEAILHIAQIHRVDVSEARAYVYSLVGQLGKFGAVHMQWSRTLTGYGWVRIGLWWRKRRKATFAGFFLSMVRAYGWLSFLLTLPFIAVWLLRGTGWTDIGVVLPGIVFGSCVVHECGHVIAAKLAGLPIVLLSHLGYASIMYARPTIGVGRLVAAAGPLLVGLVCGVSALYCPGWLVLALLGISGLHLTSLLPWCADGKTIWRKT